MTDICKHIHNINNKDTHHIQVYTLLLPFFAALTHKTVKKHRISIILINIKLFRSNKVILLPKSKLPDKHKLETLVCKTLCKCQKKAFIDDKKEVDERIPFN